MENNITNRYYWVDRIKLIACILVLMGHFISGLILSNILENNYFWDWFGKTIYYFHVPLFFICSGFLYQQKSKVSNLDDWKNNIVKKLINLGIPYLIFSVATIILKIMASDSVNNKISEGFFEILFLNPIAPYWFLYVLFFMFVFTLPIKKDKQGIALLIISLILKLISIVIENYNFYNIVPYFVKGIMINEIWFVFGMIISKYKLHNRVKINNCLILISFIVEILVSIIIYRYCLYSNSLITFILGFFICLSVIGFNINREKVKNTYIEKILIKNTMPIFLMHTIFAAFIRVVLIKINITNSIVHFVLGLLCSILLPILVTRILAKIPCGIFIIYPGKVLGGENVKNNAIS